MSKCEKLEELGHTQPPTSLKFYNTTAGSYSNETTKPKWSKSMDKRYHWVQDRVRQKQFLVYFLLGITNLSDSFTKNHTPEHFRIMRTKFLIPNRTTTLVCADIYLLS